MSKKRDITSTDSSDFQTDSIGSCSSQRFEKKDKIQRSSDKSVSSVSVSQNIEEREQTEYLNDLFTNIKTAVSCSPIKSAPGSPLKAPKSPKVLLLTFVLQKFNGHMVAVTANGPGTYHIHNWFKGNAPICGVENTFGKGIFLSDLSHSRNCLRANYQGVQNLKPGIGTWYLISARDQKDIFIEEAINLQKLWAELHPHVNNLKSIEDPANVQLDVQVVEEEVTKELFHELAFVHYNTLKSSA